MLGDAMRQREREREFDVHAFTSWWFDARYWNFNNDNSANVIHAVDSIYEHEHYTQGGAFP